MKESVAINKRSDPLRAVVSSVIHVTTNTAETCTGTIGRVWDLFFEKTNHHREHVVAETSWGPMRVQEECSALALCLRDYRQR